MYSGWESKYPAWLNDAVHGGCLRKRLIRPLRVSGYTGSVCVSICTRLNGKEDVDNGALPNVQDPHFSSVGPLLEPVPQVQRGDVSKRWLLVIRLPPRAGFRLSRIRSESVSRFVALRESTIVL